MATHNPEKLKRGLMNFYKSKSKLKSNPTPDQNVVPKTISVSRSFVMRKPSDHQEQPRRGGVEGEEQSAQVAVVERRKSVSQVEMNVEAVASFLQVKVMASDMPPFMQLHAFKCARTTFDSFNNFSSKHMAFNIKKEFDRVYGPAWHCIVGLSFGSFVTHSTGCFLYFSIDKLYILVFKTKIQKIAI